MNPVHVLLPAVAAVLLLLGSSCSPSPPPERSAESRPAENLPAATPSPAPRPPAPAAQADYHQRIGTYMPPLDNGRLEIAAPKDWVWSRAGQAYLVGFHPGGRSLNDLPRILLAVEDSPLADTARAEAASAEELVAWVEQAAADQQLRASPQPVTLGGRAWVEHVALGKVQNSLVARHILQTVAGGRLYRLQLEVFDRQLDALRANAYAVAASCRFSEAAADPLPPAH